MLVGLGSGVMMLRRLGGALIVLAFLLVVPAASAQPRVPLPPRWPTITYGLCPGLPDVGGCTYPVWPGLCANPAGCIWLADDNRFSKWHELGHVFDAQVLTDRDRAWFTRVFGFPAAAVWLDGGTGPSPGEVFADAYAACGSGTIPPPHHRWLQGWHGYRPWREPLLRVCAAIRFTALR